MLVKKGRFDPGTDCLSFLETALAARALRVLPITPEIANLSVSLEGVVQEDPADRIIAATTLYHGATLITCDEGLRSAKEVPTLW
jgi:PIN domain nuclease of toxin-antitoxin system